MERKDILEEELIHGLEGKNELEKIISAGFQGTLEIKKEERNLHLGQFKERVLKALTLEQVEERVIYPEIRKVLAEERVSKLIINAKASAEAEERYRAEAKKFAVPFLSISSPEFKGPVGLVVVSDEAVDCPEIKVVSREERLLKKGIPLEIIKGVGQKLCPKCYQKLINQAPEEEENYQVINWWEKLLGEKCLFC